MTERTPLPQSRNDFTAVRKLVASTARASRRLSEMLRRSTTPPPGPRSNPTPPSKSIDLSCRLGHSEKLTATLLLVPAAGTFLLTYLGVAEGLSEGGETIATKATAILFAASIGILSWLVFFFLFTFAPRLTGRRLSATLAAGFLFAGGLAGIDAPFITISIGGDHAVQMSLVDTSKAYEARARAAFRRANQLQALAPKVAAEAFRFEALAVSEEKFGTYSGRSGPGKVSSGFAQVGQLFRELANALSTATRETLSLQAQITSELARLKSDAYRKGSIRERVTLVAESADRLDEGLAKVEGQDLTTSITAILSTLDNIFPMPAAAKDDFEKRQNDELAFIAEMVRPVADSIRAALAELAPPVTTDLEGVRPLNALDAIYAYWRPLLPHWLAAHFVDVGPFLLLVISLSVNREAEAERKKEDESSKPRRGRPKKGDPK